MDTALKDAIVEEIEKLPLDRQAEALEAVRAVGRRGPRGTPGAQLLPSFGSIPEQDAAAMERAIADECEQIDPDAW